MLSRRGFTVAVVALVAVVGLLGCGPSSGQIKTARTARYRTDAGTVFKAVVDVVGRKHKIDRADAPSGVVLTVSRWYEKDGTYEDKAAEGDQVQAEDGAILLGYEIRVAGAGELTVQVIPHVRQVRAGYAVPTEIEEGDAAMPGWVEGKTDDLYLSIYEALKPFAVAPGA